MNPATRTRLSLFAVAAAALCAVAGCGGDSSAPPPPEAPQAPAAGVYRGLFPCANCPGIETTLWLRTDGTFFSRRAYLGDAGEAPLTAYNVGRWRSTPEGAAVVLEGRGPLHTYRRAGTDRLELETDAELDHSLEREAGAAPFTGTLRMTGVVRIDGDGAWFRECRSGLRAPIARSGDYTRLLHRYRSATAPGEAAGVEVEGRFSWAADGAPEALVIERLAAVTETRGCPGAASGAKVPAG